MPDFQSLLTELRRKQYRQIDSRHLQTIDDAITFINEIGFCLFYRDKRIELPTLHDATTSDPNTDVGYTWNWKDELAARRVVYYGKPFVHKPGFVALDLLPALYSLSDVAEVGGDHLELVRYGQISAEAHQITEVVLEKGPMSTSFLRRETGMTAQRDKTRFSRGLVEAQEKFLITMVNATSPSRAGYSYIWDSFPRFWKDEAAAGERMSYASAAETIITRYVQTTIATTPETIAKILSLDPDRISKIAASLVEQGKLRQINDDSGKPLLVSDVFST